MKNYLRLFLSDGLGSVAYNGPAPTAPGNPTLIGANDGLSTDAATGKIAQLGQTVGRAGDPAALTENREIPMPPGTTVSFGENDGVSNNTLIGNDLGVAVGNDTGNGYSAGWQIGGSSTDYNVHTDDGKEVLIDFGGAFGQIIWNGSPNNFMKFEVTRGWFFNEGWGYKELTILSAVNPTFTPDDTTPSLLLIDTTGGNFVLDIDVAGNSLINQVFTIKKISADLNTVTITMLAGTIQEIGPPAASFAFNVQGQAVTFKCGSVNAVII